jgi:hypothetical protein
MPRGRTLSLLFSETKALDRSADTISGNGILRIDPLFDHRACGQDQSPRLQLLNFNL